MTIKSILSTFPDSIANSILFHPILIQLPVHWGHQDIYQHINNAWWSHYGEIGLIAFIEKIKSLTSNTEFQFDSLLNKDSPFQLKSCEFYYKSAVVYPDKLIIASKLASMKKEEMKLIVNCYSIKLKRLAFIAEYKLKPNEEVKERESEGFKIELIELIKKIGNGELDDNVELKPRL
ncbi:hypothetical protein K502DRAFT_352010 [Neoconidiobolus thromboides FSU 785]|nr:hypothetical protein K502DRAFT_352010 [Neoconidiobolus thromboides FSU 785]